MNNTKKIIENQLKSDLPDFKSGDTISVDVRVVEGGKERIQKFDKSYHKKLGRIR